MVSKSKLTIAGLLILAFLCADTDHAEAQAVGHYMPGILNIRDNSAMPAGLYLPIYTAFYGSNNLRDAKGNKVTSIDRNRVPVPFEADLSSFMIAPTLMWMSPLEFVGIRYGMAMTVPLANTTVGAVLGSEYKSHGTGFAFADPFISPLWLAWGSTYLDVQFDYGFYAPWGSYSPQGENNVGLGFWSHLLQLTATGYVTKNKATAIVAKWTTQFNTKKEGFDLNPGDEMMLEWGISQYLSPEFELGATGYFNWQISSDTGKAAVWGDAKDRVFAAGGQLSVWPTKSVNLSTRMLGQFSARSRFEGILGTFSVTFVLASSEDKPEKG